MMNQDLPDYYEILQVSRGAHPMMITRAYRLLVAFYHPDNQETANREMFRQVLEAHAVLSDPVRRVAYDRARFSLPARVPDDDGSVEGRAVRDRHPADERQLRRLILEALYDVRRSRPYKPLLPAMAIAELFGRSMDEIQFSLWYLRGKRWIEMPDGSEIAITVAGVDEVEAATDERPRTASGDEWDMIALPAPRRTLQDAATPLDGTDSNSRNGHPAAPSDGLSWTETEGYDRRGAGS